MIQKESDAILTTYRQYFDVVLVNNDVNESVQLVEEALECATSTPQWVPVSWVYWQISNAKILVFPSSLRYFAQMHPPPKKQYMLSFILNSG